MKAEKRTKIFAALCILWMVFIYVLSAQSSSDSTFISEKMTGFAVDVMDGDNKKTTAEEAGFGGTNENIIDDIENGLVPSNDFFGINRFEFKTVIRKMAHLFLFFVLAVLVNATVISHFKKNSLKIAVLSLAFTGLYGVLDEIHQFFVPGRGCMLKDMVIDTVGGAFGVLAVSVCVFLAETILKRRNHSK